MDEIDFHAWAKEYKPPWIPFRWWWAYCKYIERAFR